MRAKQIFEFERTGDIKSSLGIGYAAKVKQIFDDLGYIDDFYEINHNGEVIFMTNLNLFGDNVNELPDNLTVKGFLDLCDSTIYKLPNNLTVEDSIWITRTNITELPNNLTVIGDFAINNTNITELPDDLRVDGYIYVNSLQNKLINFINNSKFKKNLYII